MSYSGSFRRPSPNPIGRPLAIHLGAMRASCCGLDLTPLVRTVVTNTVKPNLTGDFPGRMFA
jgi:hypothetical protein